MSKTYKDIIDMVNKARVTVSYDDLKKQGFLPQDIAGVMRDVIKALPNKSVTYSALKSEWSFQEVIPSEEGQSMTADIVP